MPRIIVSVVLFRVHGPWYLHRYLHRWLVGLVLVTGAAFLLVDCVSSTGLRLVLRGGGSFNVFFQGCFMISLFYVAFTGI